MCTLEAKINDIIQNADAYHLTYYEAETFSGPSLYFHKRALETRNSNDLKLHLEYVYAALVSWGMHRMGKRGAKMKSFNSFFQSMSKSDMRGWIGQAQTFNYGLSDEKWEIIQKVFSSIEIMESETKLIGHSKVMAHMLPNIVPPIDRNYTLKFFGRSLRNNMEYEWMLMRDLIQDFFIPVARNEGFNRQAKIWIGNQDEFPWDTSVFKVIDNLIIGEIKSKM